MLNRLLIILIAIAFVGCSTDNEVTVESSVKEVENNDIIGQRIVRLDTGDNLLHLVDKDSFILNNNYQKKIEDAKWIVYLTYIFHSDSVYCFKIDRHGSVDEDSERFRENSCILSLDLCLRSYVKDSSIYSFGFSFGPNQYGEYCDSENISFIEGDSTSYRGMGDFKSAVIGFEIQKKSELEKKEKIFEGGNSDFTLYYYQKVLQDFLDTTKCTLNPWFKEEAIKRGYKAK